MRIPQHLLQFLHLHHHLFQRRLLHHHHHFQHLLLHHHHHFQHLLLLHLHQYHHQVLLLRLHQYHHQVLLLRLHYRTFQLQLKNLQLQGHCPWLRHLPLVVEHYHFWLKLMQRETNRTWLILPHHLQVLQQIADLQTFQSRCQIPLLHLNLYRIHQHLRHHLFPKIMHHHLLHLLHPLHLQFQASLARRIRIRSLQLHLKALYLSLQTLIPKEMIIT